MENLSEVVVFLGLITATLGFSQLVALGFERSWAWGIGLLVFPPSSPVLVVKEPRRAWLPFTIALLGLAAACAAWLIHRPELLRQWKAGETTWTASEKWAFLYLITGLVVLILGFLALVVAAFRVRTLWGVAVALFLPTGVVFAVRHWAKARGAVSMMLVGLAVGTTSFVLTRYFLPIDLGPRDRIVSGERHLTLTGWDRHDYGFLAQKPDTVVLQMANPDVTDRTLKLLSGMTHLRELDLERTAVTDQGLKTLARIPALEILRLKGTKITDAGFRESIGSLETLRMIDVRGTGVTAETIQAWRQAKSGRRALR